MTDTATFADTGLGIPATAADIRNQYVPQHGNGVLPDDQPDTPDEVIAERQAVLASVDPDEALEGTVDTESDLRKRIAYLEEQNYGLDVEVQMYRRFFGSKDDLDQKVFMQSVVFLATTALEYKFSADMISDAVQAAGSCLHPAEMVRDTGFDVFICDACHKAVTPDVEPPCEHVNSRSYGTVGMLWCDDCQSNVPRPEFRHEIPEGTIKEAIGVSIPKGQPTLNPGLAPRELPSAE